MLSRYRAYIIVLQLILFLSLLSNVNTPSFWPILFLFIFLSSRFLPEFTGSAWRPLGKRYIQKMLDISSIKAGEKVYDLGSGDGRVIIEVAKRGAYGIGVEIDPLKYLISWIRIKMAGLKNARIILGNIFHADLKNADVLFIYLAPKAVEKLEKKLKKLRGTRIVIKDYKLRSLKPVKTLERERIYLYKI